MEGSYTSAIIYLPVSFIKTAVPIFKWKSKFKIVQILHKASIFKLINYLTSND